MLCRNFYEMSLRGPKGRGNLLRDRQKKPSLCLRLFRSAPKKLNGFCIVRVEIATVAYGSFAMTKYEILNTRYEL